MRRARRLYWPAPRSARLRPSEGLLEALARVAVADPPPPLAAGEGGLVENGSPPPPPEFPKKTLQKTQ